MKKVLLGITLAAVAAAIAVAAKHFVDKKDILNEDEEDDEYKSLFNNEGEVDIATTIEDIDIPTPEDVAEKVEDVADSVVDKVSDFADDVSDRVSDLIDEVSDNF